MLGDSTRSKQMTVSRRDFVAGACATSAATAATFLVPRAIATPAPDSEPASLVLATLAALTPFPQIRTCSRFTRVARPRQPISPSDNNCRNYLASPQTSRYTTRIAASALNKGLHIAEPRIKATHGSLSSIAY